MKKFLIVCLALFMVLAGFFWFAGKEEPFSGTILVGDTPLTLSRAYTNAEGPVNIYTDPQEKKALHAQIIQYPQPEGLTLQATLKEMQESLKKISSSAAAARIIPEPKTKNPRVTMATIDKEGNYFYVRRIWMPDNTIKEISMIAPLQKGQSFAEADKALSASLDKLTNPPVYAIRPGQTQPDDSLALSQLKELLKAPHLTQTETRKDGKITSVNNINPLQQLAIEFIISIPEPDVTQWLKEHIGEYDPIYLFAMSVRMARLKAPVQETVFWGMLAQLRSQADRALCKDKYVGQYLPLLQMDFLVPAMAAYAKDPKAQTFLKDKNWLRQNMLEAVAWDIQHPQTNSPDWICKSGHAVQTDDAYPKNEWQKRRNDFKRTYTAPLYQ